MKIRLDESNYIVAYATVGDLEDSIEVSDTEEVFENEPCTYYKYENNKISLDTVKKQISELQAEVDDIEIWFTEFQERYNQYELYKKIGLNTEEDNEALTTEALEKQSRLVELKAEIKSLQ